MVDVVSLGGAKNTPEIVGTLCGNYEVKTDVEVEGEEKDSRLREEKCFRHEQARREWPAT